MRWSLILALTFQLGCLPTINPLVTEQDSFFDPAFLGVWVQMGNASTWSVTHRGDRSYRVVCTDDSSRPVQFIGRLAKIQNELYLDLIPDESVWHGNQFERIHSISIHTVYRVEIKNDSLNLFVIDFNKLKRYMEENGDKLPSVTWGDRQVITATTSQLQAFIKDHPEMFPNRIELRREF